MYSGVQRSRETKCAKEKTPEVLKSGVNPDHSSKQTCVVDQCIHEFDRVGEKQSVLRRKLPKSRILELIWTVRQNKHVLAYQRIQEFVFGRKKVC
jgi:hypothetical protein